MHHVKSLIVIMILSLASTTASRANDGENHPFNVGEKLIYQMYWGPLVVGRASLEVDGIEQIDGHDCYHLIAKAKTGGLVNLLYPVDSTTESWLDVEGLFTRKFRQNRLEGTHRRNDETMYDYERKEAVITNFRKNEETRVHLESPVLDVIASLYYMRTRPLKLNAESKFTVQSGDRSYTVKVRPDQRKNLWVRPVGDVPALRLEPNPTLKVVAANKGRMWFWVSDDRRRLPLIVASDMKIGSAKLVLYKMESSNPTGNKTAHAKQSLPASPQSESPDTFAANQ